METAVERPPAATAAISAREAMAPVYDELTASSGHHRWIPELLAVLTGHDLLGTRLLDVACGTGKSFMPMVSRGWEVTGCDISPSMLQVASEKAGERVALATADMRLLPTFGEFDLVWALDDAINYLLCPEEVERSLCGMRMNLAPTGLLLFDINVRASFATTEAIDQTGRQFFLQSLTDLGPRQESIYEARLDVGRADDASSEPEVHTFRLRHFREAEILAAVERTGLECLAVHGYSADGLDDEGPRAGIHTKALYIARKKRLVRPRIKQTTQDIDVDGDLFLLRPSGDSDFQIENPSLEERWLLAALDGTHTAAELSDAFGPELVTSALANLERCGVLEDGMDDDLVADKKLERFDRQLRYFSDVTNGPTPSQCQAKLGESRIAVLGVGGLGGWAALSLSCCGIGGMRLVDFDRVELSNLNRQVLYSYDDIGRPKVKAAAERLRAFDPEMQIDMQERRLSSEAEVAQAIEGYDMVIDALDWPAYDIEHWVNSACFAAGIPFIAMSHFPPFARVGPLYVPGRTGCYACEEVDHRRKYPLYDTVIEQQRAKPSPAATLGPACTQIGGHVALDILHYLTGLAEPSTLGVSHILDLRTMEVKREPVVPAPGCTICGQRSP